jgi:hypothetical protein
MNGYKAFRYYIALKLHFNNKKFNVFENRGNVKGSYETFQFRNDRFLFEKLAKKYATDQELIQFIAANFVYGNENFIYGIEEAEEYYLQWKKVKESITKVFSDDLNVIQLEAEKNSYTLKQIFNCTLNDFPVIIKLYLGKRISPQTISILNEVKPMIDEWMSDPSMGLILENDLLKLSKMNGFFKYDQSKINKIYYDFLSNFDVV